MEAVVEIMRTNASPPNGNAGGADGRQSGASGSAGVDEEEEEAEEGGGEEEETKCKAVAPRGSRSVRSTGRSS